MAVPAQPPAQDAQQRRSIPFLPFILAGLATFVVLVIGGYAGNWAWTGFSDNDTLWDWLSLLLLPFVIATIPIWLEHGEYLDRRVKIVILAVVGAFAALVVLGYLVPLKWTGFQGNTLWDWLKLFMLPFAIATIRLWSDLKPRLSTRHYVMGLIELGVLIAVVLAGYLVPWEWTGFTGNTLWDWTALLLVPLLIPTVLMPAARQFLTMGVTERREAAEGPDDEEETPEDLGYAGPREPREAPGQPQPAKPDRRSRNVLAGGAVAAVLIGGVAGAIGFGNDGLSSNNEADTTTTTTVAATGAGAGAAAPAGSPCSQAGALTLAGGEDGRVVRVGKQFVGCLTGARPFTLATGKPGTETSNFSISGSRVAFTVVSCNDAKTVCKTQLMVARARDGKVFNPRTFDNERAAGLALSPGGGVAVMLREPAKLVLIDSGQMRDAAGGPGLDTDSLAQVGSTVYWRMNDQAASAKLSEG
jgi:hypothetical protein